MHRFALVIAAFAVALPVSASAAQSWEDASTQTAMQALDSAPRTTAVAGAAAYRLPVSVSPDAAAPTVLANFAAAGPAQGGVPCFNCVSGAQTTFNIGLTGPNNYVVPAPTYWQYALGFTTLKLTVTSCKLAFAIAAGHTVVGSWSYTATGLVQYGGYIYGFNERFTYHGAAVLTAKITCGTAKSAVKTSLYFQ
jgi:hypothetical protein